MADPVQKVVIVGRDIAAWLMALGLHQALANTGVKIEVVELPTELTSADCHATLPTHRGLHQLLGVKDETVLKFCAATYVLGQRFTNWARGRQPFMHAYDTTGIGFNNVDFIHYWVMARRQGLNVPFEDFCLGATAAKQGRLAQLRDSARTYSKAAQGYHLDAISYAQLLKAHAVKRGVSFHEGIMRGISLDGGRITSVTLHDDTVISGDLFVDATGEEAALINRLSADDFESWSHWFPCDRMMSVSGKGLAPQPAFSQVLAFRAGWIGMYPLQNRTGILATYSSAAMSDDEAHKSIPVLTGIATSGDAVAHAYRPGARKNAWVGNCVAVGDAAVSLEPIDATGLHMVHLGLSHLVNFFPVDTDFTVEAKAYNASFFAHLENIRDFSLTHYKLNNRLDEPLWDKARDMELPERLAYRLSAFEGTGRIATYDHESFEEENWTALFVGHDLIPRSYHPLVDATPAEEKIEQFQAMLNFIGAEVSDMTSMAAHLEFYAPRQQTSSF